jgi:hypothetical protein
MFAGIQSHQCLKQKQGCATTYPEPHVSTYEMGTTFFTKRLGRLLKEALPLEQFATEELKTMEKMCWRHNTI